MVWASLGPALLAAAALVAAGSTAVMRRRLLTTTYVVRAASEELEHPHRLSRLQHVNATSSAGAGG